MSALVITGNADMSSGPTSAMSTPRSRRALKGDCSPACARSLARPSHCVALIWSRFHESRARCAGNPAITSVRTRVRSSAQADVVVAVIVAPERLPR